MKITIFIGGLSGGGAERVACNLANFLDAAGDEVTLLTMSKTAEPYPISESVRRIALVSEKERKNKLKCNILRYFRLRKYVKTTDTDCFVVMLPITIAMLLHFRRLSKAPIIASERGDPGSYSKFQKILMRHFCKRADGWVFQTEDAMRWYSGRIQKGTVIPNAINPDFIRPLYQGEREKSIVGVGRLSAQKNYPLLFRAFSRVCGEFPEYQLKIFGKGPAEGELRDLATSLGISERVTFMGYVDNVPEQLEKATLFVLSSNFEGMPNALMEAMSLGLPCISTDCPVGGPKFLIDPGVNGLLVPVGAEEELASAMRAMLSSPERANSYAQKALLVRETVSKDRIYGLWRSFLRSVVSPDQ